MAKRSLKSLSSLLATLALLGCTASEKQEAKQTQQISIAHLDTYVATTKLSEKFKFEIALPGGWEFSEVLYRPTDGAVDGTTLSIRAISPKIPVSGRSLVSVAVFLKDIIKDFATFEDERREQHSYNGEPTPQFATRLTVDGADAVCYVEKHTLFECETKTTFVLLNGGEFFYEFSLSGDVATHDNLLPAFYEILKTVKLSENYVR